MLFHTGNLSNGREGMATYLILNIIFTFLVVAVLAALRALKFNRAVVVTIGVLMVSTAIFDSMIIGVGIVDYDYQLLTGLKIVGSPIEDFFYAFVVGILVPGAWYLIGKRRLSEHH